MKNTTYYFSHDYNAHNDVKILFMRQQLGMEGYGIYWFLIESLADAGGYLPIKIIPVMAMQMHVTEIKVQAVIKEFDLFQIVDNQFFSARLVDHLVSRNNIKLINSEKGKLSAKKRNSNNSSTAVQPQFNHGSTKESKGKESKGKEIINLIDENLPEIYQQKAIEYYFLNTNKKLEIDVILKFWDIFKSMNSENKNYDTKEKIYNHFMYWLKNQKYESTTGQTESQRRWDIYKEYANRFTDDSKL